MHRILANDGIHPTGKSKLEAAGFEVITEKVEQDLLQNALPNYDGIVVRSATKVRQELIDQCPNLKLIARAGVGLDNIDVEYAKSKGIPTYNTPSASSQSVAELAIAHMFSLSRSLYDSNRQMTTRGGSEFKTLKKKYAQGIELNGRTLGVIGFGRIGQSLARLAKGIGMRVIASDLFIKEATVNHFFDNDTQVNHYIKCIPLNDLLAESDFISLHLPFTGEPVLGKEEFANMKDHAYLINASRGGTVDEDAMLDALNSGKLAGAGIDVYVNEPNVREDILQHPNVSVTPHIGASTKEAQERIGVELADKIIAHFKD